MNTIKLIIDKEADEDERQFRVEAFGRPLGEFMDSPYESTDAWAVYKVLKKLDAFGLITLACDPRIDEWYEKQPNPFMGPPGPAGMTGRDGRDGRDGKCKCEDRVAVLEREIERLTNADP